MVSRASPWFVLWVPKMSSTGPEQESCDNDDWPMTVDDGVGAENLIRRRYAGSLYGLDETTKPVRSSQLFCSLGGDAGGFAGGRRQW